MGSPISKWVFAISKRVFIPGCVLHSWMDFAFLNGFSFPDGFVLGRLSGIRPVALRLRGTLNVDLQRSDAKSPEKSPKKSPQDEPIQEYQIHPGISNSSRNENPFRNGKPISKCERPISKCNFHSGWLRRPRAGGGPQGESPPFRNGSTYPKERPGPCPGLWALGTGLRRTWASCSRTVSPASCWHQHSEPHWAIWRATLKQGLPRRRALSEATRVRPRPPSGTSLR